MSFQRLRTALLLIAGLTVSLTALSQPSGVIAGTVLDDEGLPVTGAGVVVEGRSSIGTVTDLDGSYMLEVPSDAAELHFSFIGMKDVIVPIDGRTRIDVTLVPDSELLGGVVVTALGIKRSERAVSYIVQSVDESAFAVREANLVNALSGRLAGVQINASSAGLGGETKVVMRGAKSLAGNNNALYVLDGIPLPALSLTNPGDSYSIYDGSAITGDGISNFNADDISDMSALVGPSAAALYGSKAANGVMMLTTRSGEKGFGVTFSNNTTFLSPFMLPDLQTGYGQKTGYYSSWGQKLLSSPSWSFRDFFQTGWNTQNSVGVSFGTDNSSAYVSAAAVNAEGVVPGNAYDRYNFTAHHTADILDGRLHVSTLAMYMKVRERNMTAGGQYYNPLIPVYLMSPGDDIGKYAIYERYNPERGFQTQYWNWGDLNLDMQNPFWIVNRNRFETGKDRFLLGGSAKYDIAPWLNLTARVRTDYTNILSEQKNYASTLGTFAGTKGRYFYNEYLTDQTYADVLLNARREFADFTAEGTAGAAMENYRFRSTRTAGDLTGVPNLFTLANMEANRDFVKETINDRTQSLFATAQLGWRNMVFLDATLRSDWSSALAKQGEKLAPIIYPSAGLSAIVTDLFGLKSDILPYAKVRVSYAEVGNAPMRFLANPTYSVSGGVPQTVTYLTAPDFKPERTRSWETGADLRLFGGILALSATYYNSKTYNQVFTPEISRASTYNTYYVNAGRVDNHGVELSAEVKQDLGPVRWTSNATWSMNRNRIAKMLETEIDGQTVAIDTLDMGGTSGVKMRLVKGGSIGDLYVNTLKQDAEGFIWVSPTGGTVATARDRFIKAGNTNPSGMLSWRNQFDWNGLSLGFMFNARLGGVGASLTQAALDAYGVSARTAEDRDNGGVLVNGQRLTDVESYYTTVGGSGSNAIGACYIYSMTNVRLGELTLGYNIPVAGWLPFVKGLNVSLIGRNLLMIYCRAPFDPEQVAGAGNYAAGIDYFMMPSTRNVGFSIKATL